MHVEIKDGEWAVVQDGKKQATSTHPTQSEAAEEGRNLARSEETEFFLHAQDGRVREHRNYGQETGQTDGDLVGTATQTVDAATGAAGDAVRAVGAAVGPDDASSGNTRQPERLTSEAAEQPGDPEGDTREMPESLDDGSESPEERYAGYWIYSQDDREVGKPDDLFLDENDDLEYVGVQPDRTSAYSTIIPADVVRIDDEDRRMVVSRPDAILRSAPRLGIDEELTPEFEQRVRIHYGLAARPASNEGSPYGTHEGAGPDTVSREPEFSDGGDERSVRRAEEELRVETREREVGAVRVRKRVRTDRERIVVPKKRVEVTVERVPVEGDTVEGDKAEIEIGEDEIVVPVIEEEIVVEKRPVVKEEIRIRRRVVEETEVIEEDVRREEIEVDETGDATRNR